LVEHQLPKLRVAGSIPVVRFVRIAARVADPSRRISVSLLIRFSPPSLTAEQYDEVVRRLTESGVMPADGLDYEICFGSDGNLKVSQVWDSQEQLEAFGESLKPVLADMGIDPGEPEVVPVHNIIDR
jgi:hypothetical protein